MKKFVSRRRIFSSLDGVFGAERKEKREENFFLPGNTRLFQKERRERERDEVVLKKVIFCLFSQNVIVRERNDTFQPLSRNSLGIILSVV
jgi:hypothetical protein